MVIMELCYPHTPTTTTTTTTTTYLVFESPEDPSIECIPVIQLLLRTIGGTVVMELHQTREVVSHHLCCHDTITEIPVDLPLRPAVHTQIVSKHKALS